MIVDASVWCSAELPDELDHQTSLEWRERQVRRQTPMLVPALALAEVAGAVARATGDANRGRDAVRMMRAIRTLQVILPDEALMERAAEIAAHLRLRGADAIYVALADHRGLPLVTWDLEVRDRAGRFIQVLLPG